jgi:hypothetical protein
MTDEDEIFEAFIPLLEGKPDPLLTDGWFSPGDVQRKLHEEKGIKVNPSAMHSVLMDLHEDHLLDESRGNFALYDPSSVQSLSRLALAQSSVDEFDREEGDVLGQLLTKATLGDRRPSPSDRHAKAVARLVEKGVLTFNGDERGLGWAGRLGEMIFMGGLPTDMFEELPRSTGDLEDFGVGRS